MAQRCTILTDTVLKRNFNARIKTLVYNLRQQYNKDRGLIMKSNFSETAAKRKMEEEELTKWEYTIEDVERIKNQKLIQLAIEAWRLQESLHILCAFLKSTNIKCKQHTKQKKHKTDLRKAMTNETILHQARGKK